MDIPVAVGDYTGRDKGIGQVPPLHLRFILVDSVVINPSSVKNFLFSTLSRPVLRPIQSPIQLVPGSKRPGCEATTRLQLVPRSRKMWIYISIPPYAFMA
jgi:hypothetical protein